jgi:SAM-dependent methyltransferase
VRSFDALEAVALRLGGAGIPFLLGGSALLRALGLDVPVRDVDLVLRPEDREAFEAAVGEWLVSVSTEPGKIMRSAWVAKLDVEGVEVEGLGGLAMAGVGRLPFRGAGSVRVGEAEVPLHDPAVWWTVYRAYKPERAKLLEPLIVERGYDVVADRYLETIGAEDPRHRFLATFTLPDGAEVLDLGCGAGTEALRRFRVTGVDLSARQLELARERLPGARLIQADMTEVSFPDASFDGVVALYSLGHVPTERQAPLLAAIARWLRPGGLLLACVPAGAGSVAVEDDWLGAPMFFSPFDPDALAGWSALVDEVVPMREWDGAEVAFRWLLATPAGGRCR